jgi:hypothetical protein
MDGVEITGDARPHLDRFDGDEAADILVLVRNHLADGLGDRHLRRRGAADCGSDALCPQAASAGARATIAAMIVLFMRVLFEVGPDKAAKFIAVRPVGLCSAFGCRNRRIYSYIKNADVEMKLINAAIITNRRAALFLASSLRSRNARPSLYA